MPTHKHKYFNATRPTDACIEASGIRVIISRGCRLLGTKPLPQPILTNCQPDRMEHILVKIYFKISSFFSEIQEEAFGNVVCKMVVILSRTQCVYTLGPGDAIWRHGSGSKFTQVMTFCLTAPSYYLYQYWLQIIAIYPVRSHWNYARYDDKNII